MSTASVIEPSEDWELSPEGTRAASLIIEWRRSIKVYPWYLFKKAEGNGSSIDLEFGDDVITVTGKRLNVLLRAVAEYRVLRLIQPSENEAKFDVRGDKATLQTGRPTITQILIDGKSEFEHAKDDEGEFDEDDEIPEEEQ